jgi:hypothetical protein
MGLGYILPMKIQNNWRNQMVAENHQSSSSYFDNLKSSSSSGTKYKNKRKKRNKEIIPGREKSSHIIKKRQFILPNKFNNFQVELYRPNRSEQKSKIEEGLSDNLIEIVKLDEESNFKSKRINSNIPSSSSLPSSDKEIRTDNIAAMYNFNKKSGAMNLYRMSRKIWKLSEINYLQLKAAHISGRINVATDRLSRLEMSGDYQLRTEVFQTIQRRWKCFPKVDLFTSKLNRLVKTYASVIPRN